MHIKPRIWLFVVAISSIAALSGLLFGYDTGVISGAILFIQHQFPMSTVTTEIVVSSVLFGACIGALISGVLSDHFGRKKLLILAGIAFITGTLLSAYTHSILFLILGRLVVGFAIGIASYVAPLYLSEIAPKHIRGALVLLNTITVTGGIVLAYLVDLCFEVKGSWRWMLGLGVVPAIFLALGVLFLPDSPRWMAKKGFIRLAHRILIRIRPRHEIPQELKEIRQNIACETQGSFKDLREPTIRPILILGIGLAVIQQVTGINTILYYAPVIFKMAGFQSTIAELLATLGMGITNFVMTIVAMLVVDRIGRRPLLLVGLTMMTVCLASASLIFHYEPTFHFLKWFSVISLVIFVAFYAISIGCLFWLIIAEIYPLNIRGTAMSVATMSNWAANLVVAFTFLTLIKSLGPSGTFLIYAIASLLSLVFCYVMVPETKQISLEKIELNLRTGRRCRDLGE